MNLFVGKNNAGKTSVLEAVELSHRGGHPLSLIGLLRRRGEYVTERGENLSRSNAFDMRRLFHGHGLHQGNSFQIISYNQKKQSLTVKIASETLDTVEGVFDDSPFFNDENLSSLQLQIEDSLLPAPVRVALSNGRINNSLRGYQRGEDLPLSTPIRSLFLENYAIREPIVRLWGEVVGNPEENLVVSALRIIEPDIERIVFAPDLIDSGLFFVKMSTLSERVPMGTFGEGMRRLLTIATHLACAKGGILLIDEIDTGLHHSTLEQLWKMIVSFANQEKIQVLRQPIVTTVSKLLHN